MFSKVEGFLTRVIISNDSSIHSPRVLQQEMVFEGADLAQVDESVPGGDLVRLPVTAAPHVHGELIVIHGSPAILPLAPSAVYNSHGEEEHYPDPHSPGRKRVDLLSLHFRDFLLIRQSILSENGRVVHFIQWIYPLRPNPLLTSCSSM